ncbi:lanthionine synthetase C family protein [Aquimarina sp. MMG015]|uniref:lanthionine synthetase C family protein n=1 Tax=Aquimarina sp. MMG015 TaxID=2822689 RepID=UPI001B3A0F61|nr:lanthionine synthetase C family protein [Aquimarina sp. MMG015]MBQ4803091.1 lanthionine synthetase C family protein [Aquimarina sp. MMG015]
MTLNERLENKLDEIADCLLHLDDDNVEIGALTGISGNAMFHFYYADYKSDDKHREKGSQIIKEVFNRIEKGYSYPTFCDGIAGALWVLELLKEEHFVELEEDIITKDVDEYLFDKMKAFIADNDFDFMHGAIGIGFYYLKRYQNVTSKALKDRYKDYLNVLIDAISEKAITKNGVVKWESEIRSGEYIAKGYNLGLAHGIPSIINFLSRLAVYSEFSHQIEKLLSPSCFYILSCRHQGIKLTSSFPNWIVEEESDIYNSRLAWCYGDLGIGVSLLKAGQILKDDILLEESIRILKKTTYRKDMVEAGIKDGGICHGAYGVMHIYQHLYNETNDLSFMESSKNWSKIALDLAVHKDGYAGYKEYSNIEQWISSMNLLGGVAGMGLSILYYLSSKTSFKWSEAFLIR